MNASPAGGGLGAGLALDAALCFVACSSDHTVSPEAFDSIASAFYSKVAFPLLRRVSGVNPLVVYYHIVNDGEVPHISNLYSFRSVPQFKRDLDVLLRFFRPLSLQNLLRGFEDDETPTRTPFVLTFDDGLRQCYDIIAPILKSYGVPAVFFLCSAFIDNRELAYDHKKGLLCGLVKEDGLSSIQKKEIGAALKNIGIVEPDLGAGLLQVDYCRRQVLDHIADVLEYDFGRYLETIQPYLTSDQVMAMLQLGHAVGAHSIDHPRYADLSIEEQLHQTRASVRFVKERFGIDYGAFSFPHSDAHVSKEFFREIFVDGELDVCFGNQGLLDDDVHRNIQRSSMEEAGKPAEAILGRGYVRRLFKSITGHLVIRRP